MEGIYLYGAGGHAKVIKEILDACRIPWMGIVDDNLERKVFLDREVMHEWKGNGRVIVCIGANGIRRKVVEQIEKCPDTTFGTAVHPSAMVSPSAIIEEGSVVMQGSIIQSEARIGKHCIVNTGASIDHECILGDYVHVSPHATLCGNVTVGEGAWIGAGAVVIPGIRIGKNAIVGAGAVVCKDVPEQVVAVGNPCRILRKLE